MARIQRAKHALFIAKYRDNERISGYPHQGIHFMIEVERADIWHR